VFLSLQEQDVMTTIISPANVGISLSITSYVMMMHLQTNALNGPSYHNTQDNFIQYFPWREVFVVLCET
jgi:hypothetical protein